MSAAANTATATASHAVHAFRATLILRLRFRLVRPGIPSAVAHQKGTGHNVSQVEAESTLKS